MPQDPVDGVGLGNEGDEGEAAATAAQQRVHFEHPLDEPRPRSAARLEVRLLELLGILERQSGDLEGKRPLIVQSLKLKQVLQHNPTLLRPAPVLDALQTDLGRCTQVYDQIRLVTVV